MTNVINLRMARKARARQLAQDTAAHNRARHGQTRANRDAQASASARAAHDLAGKQLICDRPPES